MRLADLVGEAMRLSGDGTLEITGLTADSRAVRPGVLFAALPGGTVDGRAFIAEAVEHGAAAVLVAEGAVVALPARVALVTATRPRHAFARMAGRFFGRQPATVVAVTGTNGKTSTAVFTEQLWSALGVQAASLGTLGLDGPVLCRPGRLTTPDPVRLHEILAEAADAGVEALCMEASSHGLDQSRLDGVHVAAAAFTNLSRDHLDYHGTEEAYAEAKRRLFTDVLEPGGTAVLNADDPSFAVLMRTTERAGRRVLDYGAAATDLCLEACDALPEGQRLRLSVLGHRHTVVLPLIGAFQAANALAALGLVIATGADPAKATAALAGLRGVPGRMQMVGRVAGASVIVDYAHTPDALRVALTALRPHVGGRLIVVFGCGGDRDRGKRPQMGAIAAALADRVIVTDDNPRTETPAAIRAEILAGAPEAEAIGDRRTAIGLAIAALEAGDVLLLAGKGHETGQIVGAATLPFDDREEARKALQARGGEIVP
jgi:UDP-N-acetylmuramoyl-L-alanyl-D-glutamate--2,6-diaminopimelate ligase